MEKEQFNAEQVYSFLNSHPIFQLATCENGIPKVRHMLLFKADETGLYFHTSFQKEVCSQLLENNVVELCFFDIYKFMQIRVEGKATLVNNENLKEEILKHPTRLYMHRLKALIGGNVFDDNLVIFRVVKGRATVWTVEDNFNHMENYPKHYIDL